MKSLLMENLKKLLKNKKENYLHLNLLKFELHLVLLEGTWFVGDTERPRGTGTWFVSDHRNKWDNVSKPKATCQNTKVPNDLPKVPNAFPMLHNAFPKLHKCFPKLHKCYPKQPKGNPKPWKVVFQKISNKVSQNPNKIQKISKLGKFAKNPRMTMQDLGISVLRKQNLAAPNPCK